MLATVSELRDTWNLATPVVLSVRDRIERGFNPAYKSASIGTCKTHNRIHVGHIIHAGNFNAVTNDTVVETGITATQIGVKTRWILCWT